jgi:hypothetical protein
MKAFALGTLLVLADWSALEGVDSDNAESKKKIEQDVAEPEAAQASGPGLWGRLKLRQLKDRVNYVLNDDPELQDVIKQYSDSDESVEKLQGVLEEMGAFRKAEIAEPAPKFISAAEKEYSKIDPNLDTKTGTAPATPNGDIPDTGLGTTGYVAPQVAIDAIENMVMPNSLGDIDMEEISKNGFTSPVVLLYKKETNKFTLKNPEIDSNKLLAARQLKRLAPIVVEIDGKSQNPRFSSLTTPTLFKATSYLTENYPDISGIPDLPVPERSQAEKDAIEAYRGWSYLDIKTHMETPGGSPNKNEEERKKLDEIVENLNKVTKTEPIPEGTVLYRGFSLAENNNSQELYDYFSKIEVGSTIAMPPRFTSTTLDPDVAENFSVLSPRKIAPEDMKSVVLKIVAGEGATGAAFENDKTIFSREKEVLLPIEANVVVTNVVKDSDGVLRIEGVYAREKAVE